MTDLPASWQTDPTGRHDHRYWDGTSWTDHVADAGVASRDAYEAAPPAPSTETVGAGSTGSDPVADTPTTPAATSSWTSPATGDDPTAAEEPPSVPGLRTGWGTTGAPDTAASSTAPASAASASPGARSDGGDAPTDVTPGTGGDAPTLVTPGISGDAPTAVTPVPGWSSPTGTSAAPGVADSDAAGGGPGDGSGATGGDNRRRNLLLAVAAAVVIAVIALVAITGNDSDGRKALTGRIADSLRDTQPALSKKDANCMADHIVDDVGEDRLKDLEFDADQPQSGRLGSDLASATAAAVDECEVSGSSFSGSEPGSSLDLPDVGDIEKYTDLLADQYAATLGLSATKARCLADALGDAIREGRSDQRDAFGDIFSYLDTCGISLDELTG